MFLVTILNKYHDCHEILAFFSVEFAGDVVFSNVEFHRFFVNISGDGKRPRRALILYVQEILTNHLMQEMTIIKYD